MRDEENEKKEVLVSEEVSSPSTAEITTLEVAAQEWAPEASHQAQAARSDEASSPESGESPHPPESGEDFAAEVEEALFLEAEPAETIEAAASSEMNSENISEESSERAVAQGPITLIVDPFGIKNLEISDAQNNPEELEIDTELDTEVEMELDKEIEAAPTASAEASAEEVDAQMNRLSEIMANEEKKRAEEVEALVAPLAEQEAAQLAERLAEEIAADEALALELQQAAEEKLKAESEILQALPQLQGEADLDIQEVASCIEALLFISDKPLSAERLQILLSPEPPAKAEEDDAPTDTPSDDAAADPDSSAETEAAAQEESVEKIPFHMIQEGLTWLRDSYKKPGHGLELVEVAGGFQIRTKPIRAALAKKLAKVQTQRLSSGAMETLTIIAYKQPALKDDVDSIRGVDSSHFIRGLLDKKLIRISGRSELPGRPMLYSTTTEFLELFGLKSISDLPSLRELEQMVPASQSDRPDEDPRVREMRRLVGEMKTDPTRLQYDSKEDEKILQEIRQKVNSISITTKTLEDQKAAEKAAAEAAEAGIEQLPAADTSSAPQPSLPLE